MSIYIVITLTMFVSIVFEIVFGFFSFATNIFSSVFSKC